MLARLLREAHGVDIRIEAQVNYAQICSLRRLESTVKPDLEVVQIGREESFKAWSHGYPFRTVRWHFHPALCDNDVETSHPREFTLEGRGQCIRWLCPLSLTIRLLPAALKQKEAVGRPSFQR